MIKYTSAIYPNIKSFSKIPSFYHIKSDFEKIAYDMADPIKEFIETIQPTKDSNFYWVNALGAGETWGSNNRGDFFPRQELIDHHQSFVETPARVYIQHRNKDPQYSLGEVVYSHFNPDTDRVELIERIDWPLVNKYASDWIRYGLQRNDVMNTSMGCKVAYDVCSICGNQARTTDLYCDHAKYAMNQFIDNRQVYVENIDPKFFDNSIVQRGADRTARIMAKVASEVDDPDIITKDSDLKIFSLYIPEIKTENLQDKIAETFAYTPTLSKEFLNKFLPYEIEEILGTTKAVGMDLKPEEYQYVVLNKIGDAKLANDLFDKQEVFSVKDAYDPQPIAMKLNEELLEGIYQYIPERSNKRAFVLHRNLTKDASEKSPINTTFDNELGEVLGKGYVSYMNMDFPASKEAGLIENLLLTLFLQMPEISKLRDYHKDVNMASEKTLLAMKSPANSSKLPLMVQTNVVNPIPVFVSNAPMYNVGGKGFFNPIYQNPFLQGKTASLKDYGHLALIAAPYAAGAGSTLYLAGKDKQREQAGDPRVGTGLAGFAHKHPIITSLGVTYGTKKLMNLPGKLMKKASDDIEDYKNYLRTVDNHKLLDTVEQLTDEVFLQILN